MAFWKFITHNPHHAYPVGDRFVILNRGRLMGSWKKGEISRDDLVLKMSGGAELEARDARDQPRAVSPLKPAADAMLLDNSALTVESSVDAVLKAWEQRRPFEK